MLLGEAMKVFIEIFGLHLNFCLVRGVALVPSTVRGVQVIAQDRQHDCAGGHETPIPDREIEDKIEDLHAHLLTA